MIARYNTVSFLWGVPGLIMQVVGLGLRVANMHEIRGQLVTSNVFMDNMGRLVLLVGTVSLLIGLGYYAKAKGRSSWWCLFAFLSVLGLLVLACLKDHTEGREEDKSNYVGE